MDEIGQIQFPAENYINTLTSVCATKLDRFGEADV